VSVAPVSLRSVGGAFPRVMALNTGSRKTSVALIVAVVAAMGDLSQGHLRKSRKERASISLTAQTMGDKSQERASGGFVAQNNESGNEIPLLSATAALLEKAAVLDTNQEKVGVLVAQKTESSDETSLFVKAQLKRAVVLFIVFGCVCLIWSYWNRT